MFLPLRLAPEDRRRRSAFTTADGLELAGSYLPPEPRAGGRTGLLPRIPERSLELSGLTPTISRPRLRHLHVRLPQPRRQRERPAYRPLQWVTDHEVRDLRGCTGLPARAGPTATPPASASSASAGEGAPPWSSAAERADVWGLITDGAFPTRGTMLAYILRWAEIYREQPRLCSELLPRWVFRFLGWFGLRALPSGGSIAGSPTSRRAVAPARAPSLADDPRRRTPTSARRSPGALRRGAATEGDSGSCPGPSTTAAARSSPTAYAGRIDHVPASQHAPRRPGHHGSTVLDPRQTLSSYSTDPARPVGSPRLVPSVAASVTS